MQTIIVLLLIVISPTLASILYLKYKKIKREIRIKKAAMSLAIDLAKEYEEKIEKKIDDVEVIDDTQPYKF